jgi:hypothetical protein
MSNTNHGGKGDKPRPIPNREKFEKNWDSIFKPKGRKTDDKNIPKGIK